MSSESVLTPIGRINFTALDKPRSYEGGPEKYSVVFIWEKSKDDAAIREAIAAAAKEKWGDSPPAGLKNPIRDGDAEMQRDGKTPQYPGCYFMRNATDFEPSICDGTGENRVEATDGRIYNGANARLMVKPYSYDKAGNRGVSLGLEAVQVTGGGAPFSGGGVDATKVFGECVTTDEPGTMKF